MKRILLFVAFFALFTTSGVFGQVFQDTIRYTYVKEAYLGSNTYNTLAIWQSDNESITQTFLLSGATHSIKGVEIYGSNHFKDGNGKASIQVRASIFNVDANYTPTTSLGSGLVTINSTTPAYHYVNFSTPIDVSSNYAVVIETITPGGILSIYVNNAVPNQSYDELLTRFRSSYYPKSANQYVDIPKLTTGDNSNWPSGPYNFEPLISPIIAYTQHSAATVSDSLFCFQNTAEYTGTSAPDGILSNRMYNFNTFSKYFQLAVADSTYQWDMGDGSKYIVGKQHSYKYANPGTYTATYYTVGGFWAGYPISVSKTVTAFANPAPVFAPQPLDTLFVNKGKPTTISASTDNATSYRWQLKSGSVFSDISNGAIYSGATTAILAINSATENMDGNQYRCVAIGECTYESYSDTVVLKIILKENQSISIAAKDTVMYGTADYDVEAISSASLVLSYTSSDEGVATIEQGKIHIKSVGTTTITASQEGNEHYNPASSVQQVLTVSHKPISVTLNNSPAITKIYDGTDTAIIVAANYSLAGLINSDDVSATGTGNYSSSNVSASQIITVKDLVLSGSKKDNYLLDNTTATTNGAITPKTATVLLNASPAITKIYDGTDTAIIGAANYSLAGLINSDDVSATGTGNYSTSNVSASQIITVKDLVLSGSKKDNYLLDNTTATTTGTITPKTATVLLNASPAITKIYDGTDTAIIGAANYSLAGLINSDDVSATGTGNYSSSNVSASQIITVKDLVLSGSKKDNYLLANTTATTNGAITPKTATVLLNASPAITKVYDGNNTASLNAGNSNITGIINDDVVNITGTATYDDGNAGALKTVSYKNIALTGSQASNYQLAATIATTSGSITKKPIAVTANAQSKVYGSTDPELSFLVTGLIGSDQLAGNLVREAGKNVGKYIINQGNLSAGDNYNIHTFHPDTLKITPATLLISVENKTRKQGLINPVFTVVYDGLVGGDLASNLTTAAEANTVASTISPIGYYPINISGASSENYTITMVPGTLTIVPSGDKNMKSWVSSPNEIQVRIYSETAQKGAIGLHAISGINLIKRQVQLNPGINSFTLSVGELTAGIYILQMNTAISKEAQPVKIK